jgi:hypothetical protein
VLEGEGRPRSSEAGIDLVEHEYKVILTAERSQLRKKSRGRNDIATASLYGLDDHAADQFTLGAREYVLDCGQ